MNVDETVNELKKKFGCPIWPTQSGDLVPVKIMAPSHLVNAYKFLLRRKAGLSSEIEDIISATHSPDPSMAMFYAKGVDELLEIDAVVMTWLRIFERWAQIRNIELPDEESASSVWHVVERTNSRVVLEAVEVPSAEHPVSESSNISLGG